MIDPKGKSWEHKNVGEMTDEEYVEYGAYLSGKSGDVLTMDDEEYWDYLFYKAETNGDATSYAELYAEWEKYDQGGEDEAKEAKGGKVEALKGIVGLGEKNSHGAKVVHRAPNTTSGWKGNGTLPVKTPRILQPADKVKTPGGPIGFIMAFHGKAEAGKDLAEVFVPHTKYFGQMHLGIEESYQATFTEDVLEFKEAGDWVREGEAGYTTLMSPIWNVPPDSSTWQKKPKATYPPARWRVNWNRGTAWGGAYKSCSHDMDALVIEPGITLYGSGYKLISAGPVKGKAKDSKPTETKKKMQPTAGLYLFDGWIKSFDTPYTNDTIPGLWRKEGEMPVMYYPWPDYGDVSIWTLSVLALWARQKAQSGYKVEVACQGGHGRTGTLLAATLIYSGLSAEEAVKKVRKEYCTSAVEGQKQPELLKRLEKSIRFSQDEEVEKGTWIGKSSVSG